VKSGVVTTGSSGVAGAARRTAARSRASSSSMPNGFVTLSSAPASSAATFVCSCPHTDSTMIGVEAQPRTPWITSVPSMSGRPRSRISTSGRSRDTAARPEEPSSAVVTS
jgi:hypothetical protein